MSYVLYLRYILCFCVSVICSVCIRSSVSREFRFAEALFKLCHVFAFQFRKIFCENAVLFCVSFVDEVRKILRYGPVISYWWTTVWLYDEWSENDVICSLPVESRSTFRLTGKYCNFICKKKKNLMQEVRPKTNILERSCWLQANFLVKIVFIGHDRF